MTPGTVIEHSTGHYQQLIEQRGAQRVDHPERNAGQKVLAGEFAECPDDGHDRHRDRIVQPVAANRVAEFVDDVAEHSCEVGLCRAADGEADQRDQKQWPHGQHVAQQPFVDDPVTARVGLGGGVGRVGTVGTLRIFGRYFLAGHGSSASSGDWVVMDRRVSPSRPAASMARTTAW